MRINTKCSLAIHILLLVAAFSDSNKMTSEIIAKSTGNNPVIIRNILGSLKKAGIVHVQQGSGGTKLALPPSEITLWDIYQAVDPVSLDNLIGIHANPSSICPVGKRINMLLAEPYGAVTDAVQKSMSEYTLADIIRRYEASVQDEKANEGDYDG